jgi:hypothetical protein
VVPGVTEFFGHRFIDDEYSLSVYAIGGFYGDFGELLRRGFGGDLNYNHEADFEQFWRLISSNNRDDFATLLSPAGRAKLHRPLLAQDYGSHFFGRLSRQWL